MYFIPTHPKALLFTRQDGIGDFYEPFVAEFRATEIGIEARHRLSPRGFVLYSQFRCQSEKVNKIKGGGMAIGCGFICPFSQAVPYFPSFHIFSLLM